MQPKNCRPGIALPRNICAYTALAAALFLPAVPAHADISDLYDNTMVSYHDDGHVHKMYFNRDGSWQVKENGITFVSGTYTYKSDGDLICMKILSTSADPGPSGSKPVASPAPAPTAPPKSPPEPRCQPLESNHGIDVYWDHMANGKVERNVIVRGRD